MLLSPPFFTQVGPMVIGAVILFFYYLLYIPILTWHMVLAYNVGFETFAFYAFCLTGGVMGWCYLHFLWVKPSRLLFLGIQQVSTSQSFQKKSFQNNRSKCDHS